ncbi:MAG: hypothetical protein R2874_15600 [Desulfobacterales bacterium]
MDARNFRIVLQEGRKRQIRRMVESVGGRVAARTGSGWARTAAGEFEKRPVAAPD